MTDVPNFEQRRLNAFDERLRRMQDDITGLNHSHRNLQRSVDGMRSEMNARFDTLELRLETMIEEIRRFFNRYEHIDAER